MTSPTCLLAWTLALLLLPALFIAWLLETQPERIRRLRAAGMTQRAIATHLGITVYQVRKALI